MWRIREAGDIVDVNLGTAQQTLEHEGATTELQMNVVMDSYDSREIRAVITQVTVYPEEGNFSAIARALLEVAEHPRQVRSVSNPRAGFEVPMDVFERFALAWPYEDIEIPDEVDHQVGPPAQTEPPKRRPGRPRKNTEES